MIENTHPLLRPRGKNRHLFPLGLTLTDKGLLDWLKSRVIPRNREFVDKILSVYGLDHNNILGIVKLCMGLSVNDSYWIIPEGFEGKFKDYNLFELRDAIVSKDVLKANRIVKYLDNNPKVASIYAFLPGIFSFFQNLMVAHYTDRTERGVMTALGYKSEGAVKDYMRAMKVYSPSKTMDIIHQIRVTDTKSKGIDNPNTSPGDLMRELVYFILH